jgi:geranylgeranyl pyrophosphate synthase
MYTQADLQQWIEEALRAQMPRVESRLAAKLNQAIEYALFPGGKRLRPILCLLSTAAVLGEANLDKALPTACAVEFLHASSMIFDDLPCMDDAQVRRGKPAVHIEFGEHLAVLAAIGLLNRSYELLGTTPELLAEATRCIGVEGMVGGQAIDLSQTGASFTAADLADRNAKTSALVRLAMTSGAILGGASPDRVEALASAGLRIGQAYQIFDDLMDHLKTGKTPGQDMRHERPSHAALQQAKDAIREAQSLVAAAQKSIREAAGDRPEAESLTGFIDSIFAAGLRHAGDLAG